MVVAARQAAGRWADMLAGWQGWRHLTVAMAMGKERDTPTRSVAAPLHETSVVNVKERSASLESMYTWRGSGCRLCVFSGWSYVLIKCYCYVPTTSGSGWRE